MTFIVDKLKGVVSHYEADGMRGILDAVRTNIWERRTFLLFAMNIADQHWDIDGKCGNLTLRKGNTGDIGMIVDSWPREFERVYKTRKILENEITKRFNDNIPCFVATDNGSLVSAIWGTPWNYTFDKLKNVTSENATELINLFVNPNYRKLGIGSQLIKFSIMQMAKINYTYAMGRILPHRTVIQKALYNIGYSCLGRMTYTTVFGSRSCRFEEAQQQSVPSSSA